jgi:hypothetical protein
MKGVSTRVAEAASGPLISNIWINSSNLQTYEKMEIHFDVDTVASNPYFPYDPNPPSGIDGAIGISVTALFSPDGWNTIYQQPAFYFQDFEHQVKGGRDWIYPKDHFYWIVRFSPPSTGNWEFKLVGEDLEGRSETSVFPFTVNPSSSKGFIQVSEQDQRYFEFEDGTYFPGIGYNMNYRQVDWVNPILANQDNFKVMGENHIQLVRIWLSQWAIFGSEWNPWRSFVKNGYLPSTFLEFVNTHPESEVALEINATDNKCVVIGWETPTIPLKRNTQYRIRIRHSIEGLGTPLISSEPYGLVAKSGGWLWSNNDPTMRCDYPGTGNALSPHQNQNTTGWEVLEGTFNSGDKDFIELFYLTIENVAQGTAYIDHVWIEEDYGNGSFGPNLLQKPDMDHHYYFDQRNSFAFDLVLKLAEQEGIYLRPVIHEKNERIFNHINFDGVFDLDNPSNDYFYGNRRTSTKVRWLQRAWWRYLQARWGYSTNIHSWELLNEGDPWSQSHYILADEFGKYMHQFNPNDHLVSTSTWHSFPRDAFWANSSYPNVDFADIHKYIPQSDPNYYDAALATIATSLEFGAYQSGGAGIPIIRGETGFTTSGSEPPSDELQNDLQGIWLHNFLWGSLNAGGLIESYWYENVHIYDEVSGGSPRFDHRPHFRALGNFVSDIPLNIGEYEDLSPIVSNPNIRVWGQMDHTNNHAFFWVQNSNHTWKKVLDNIPISAESGTVEIGGFWASSGFWIEWWDTYQADPGLQIIGRSELTTSPEGVLTINIDQLSDDRAVKIYPSSTSNTTFQDVSEDHWAFDFIEALYQAGYISGCSTSPLLYCPERGLNRAESSVFTLRGEYGAIPEPPHVEPSTPTFGDVASSFWGYGWIESLWADGFTAGCSANPLLYCPDREHTRAEGTVFFLRMKYGPDYQPSDPNGIFADVDPAAWYSAWVEAAYNEGLLPSCGENPLIFCPDDPLNRAWAAYMMVQTKGGLPLD